jgi:hypothetical protein
MGLRPTQAGRTANPVAMRGLRLSAGVSRPRPPCAGVTGHAVPTSCYPRCYPRDSLRMSSATGSVP